MSVNDFVTNPLNIILVRNGSKGDRLLFRYPFTETKKETVVKNTKQNPFAINAGNDAVLQRSVPSSNISNGHLVGFPDKDLSNLFAVKAQLCGKKFELKVNDVRFVGHPILLQSPNSYRAATKGQTSTIILFNIVFALWANASHSIVQNYHDLSCRLGIALSYEEKRCGYLSKEDEYILSAHDELSVSEGHKETPFDLILQRSQLARELKQVYDDLCSTGYVYLRMNNWLQISFCLLQKVHQLHDRNNLMNQESLKKCLEALRPYHAILLLVDEKELLRSLPLDASTSLMRLIQVASPLKSLKELSADADLSLPQVFQLVGHLVYWAKATIIYPLCETNVYVLSPQAPTHVSSHLVEKFAEKFPGDESLLAVMSEFSLPVSLSQRENLINLPHQQKQLLQMIIWMLQHNLLMQLHTYVYLIPTPQGGSLLTDERQDDAKPNSPNEIRVLYTGSDSDLGSVTSEEYALSPVLSHCDSTVQSTDIIKRIPDNLFPDLNAAERENILRVPAANNSEDLGLFKRLYKYFNGTHHLEEIMYLENIRRTQLLALIDKFREVLFTCQHEDDVAAVFYTHSKT